MEIKTPKKFIMLSIAQVKVGMHLKHRGEPYRVVSATHTKLGRGGGILKVKIKNLMTGAIIDQSFRDSDRLEEADLSHRQAQFLYRDGETLHFMDPQTFDQFTLSASVLGQAAGLVKDGSMVDMLYFSGKPIGAQLPPKVDLVVTYTEPAVAGNTVSNVMKNATLETGTTIKVPLFIKTGNVVRVNTETGEYVERVR